MIERFTRTYCVCKEWQGAKEKERSLLLKQYPNQCPYCHTELKSESTAGDVRILFEGTATTFDEPRKLSLVELKDLLKEI